jgi:small subunit ribosomal protein S20
LANSLQARKRARQGEKRRQLKSSQRSTMRTAIKKVLYAIRDGNKEQAVSAYNEAVPVIDSMVNKGITHKNKAARHKSRLNNHVKSMS